MPFQITLYLHFFSSSKPSVCTPKIGIPTKFKRFDLIVDRLCWFEKPFQKLLNFCRTEEFFETASKLNGYNINNLGTVHFNSK